MEARLRMRTKKQTLILYGGEGLNQTKGSKTKFSTVACLAIALRPFLAVAAVFDRRGLY